MFRKLNVSLNEHGGNGENCVFNFSLHCLEVELTVRFTVHGRPTEYQWIRNGTGVIVRKPPYTFKRIVNVYKVRLNVYNIKRWAHP